MIPSDLIIGTVDDMPPIGTYHGEIIEVVFSIDPDDIGTNLGENILLIISEILDRFFPYKHLQYLNFYLHHQKITDRHRYWQELEFLAENIEQISKQPDGYKYLVITWCPYWEQGDCEATIGQEGKYIYSQVILKKGGPGNEHHFPETTSIVHEIVHSLGLKGDNSVATFDLPHLSLLCTETVTDYDACGEFLAKDELVAISNVLFNNKMPNHGYLFGCREGKQIFWYHKYVNTNTPHKVYSATWEEVSPMLEGINSGAYINKDPCKENMTEKYTKEGKISEQWLAEEIAKAEGLKKSVDIAQIKEILRIALELLATLSEEEVNGLLAKH